MPQRPLVRRKKKARRTKKLAEWRANQADTAGATKAKPAKAKAKVTAKAKPAKAKPAAKAPAKATAKAKPAKAKAKPAKAD